MAHADWKYVRLDVGGQVYTTSKQTLTRFEDTFLAKLILPENDHRKSEYDYIAIDRDGKHFGAILEYLRDSLNLIGWTEDDLNELGKEADFYGLTGLEQMIEDKIKDFGNDLLSELLPDRSFIGFFDETSLMKHLRKNNIPAKVIKFRDSSSDMWRVIRRVREVHNFLPSDYCKYILFEDRDLKEVGVCEKCERAECPPECRTSHYHKTGFYEILEFDPRSSRLQQIRSFRLLSHTSNGRNDSNDGLSVGPLYTSATNRGPTRSDSRSSLINRR